MNSLNDLFYIKLTFCDFIMTYSNMLNYFFHMLQPFIHFFRHAMQVLFNKSF